MQKENWESVFVWLYFYLRLSVSFCTCLCGSKDGTLIPSEADSLAARAATTVCQTVLIKRQQHARLPLVLGLICLMQITIFTRGDRKTSLCCSFFLSLVFHSFFHGNNPRALLNNFVGHLTRYILCWSSFLCHGPCVWCVNFSIEGTERTGVLEAS